MTPGARSQPARLVVCADDFGLNPQVNKGVLRLAATGRISAFSCLVDAPAAAAGAAELRGAHTRPADVGLHLNLKEAFEGARLHLRHRELIARTYSGLVDRDLLRAEIRRQLDRFEALFDGIPDHVDSHLHVHQLRWVRDLLLAELADRYLRRLPWVRIGVPPASVSLLGDFSTDQWKAKAIGLLRADAFTAKAARSGFAMNRHLLGVYPFQDTSAAYLQRLARWVAQTVDGDLLLCHPAASPGRADPLAVARAVEYRVLAGTGFADVLASECVQVVRMAQVQEACVTA